MPNPSFEATLALSHWLAGKKDITHINPCVLNVSESCNQSKNTNMDVEDSLIEKTWHCV